MGKPTFDNGIPSPCVSGAQTRRAVLGRARGLRIANAMPGFGLPLSQEGIKLLNT